MLDKVYEKRFAKIESEISHLLELVKELKQEIKTLQPSKFGPITPVNPPTWPFTPPNIIPENPSPWKTGIETCPKCGIEMRNVMGYVCNRMDCPTGLGPTWCKSEE